MKTLTKILTLMAVAIMVQSFVYAQETPSKVDEEIGNTKNSEVSVVLDLERPSNTDIVLLRNGDKLTGTVLNESFSIRTSYTSLKFNNRIIAGIDLEGGANNIEAIVAVNNNRFSGFIDDPVIVFKLQTGPKIEVRREKVLKVIFRVREAERKGIPQNQFVVLKNGDFFSGKVLNSNLMISTTYAKVPLNLNDAESVTMIGGDSPLTKVLMRNGDVIQGVLETEDIKVDLDIADEISIYQDRIGVLYCKEGYIPDLDMLASPGVVAITSSKDDYEFELPGDSILVKSVPKSSPYHGHLQPGDRIVAVDGKAYPKESGKLSPIREELISGKRAQITLTVARGDKKFFLRLIKK